MVTKQKLLEQMKLLRAENKFLQKNVSFFPRVSENTETVEKLNQHQIPYFVEKEKLSYVVDGEPVTTLIEGDNLSVLIGLNYKYENKVDIIYIDPPYNTGKKVYTYNDSYNKADNGSHSMWLTFMENRLKLTPALLRDTGVIMVSVGSKEQAYLKLLLDEIYGEQNFIAMVTIEGVLKNNSKYVSDGADYLLIYSKNIEVLNKENPIWRALKPSAKTLLAKGEEIWLKSNYDSVKATAFLRKYFLTVEAKTIFVEEPGLKMYNKIDEAGRIYRSGDLSSPSGVGGQYTVVNPVTSQPVALPARGWVHSQETFNKMIKKNLIIWNEQNIPTYKRFLDENINIVHDDVMKLTKENPNRLLQKIIGRGKFSYPKNHYMLIDWFNYITPNFRLNNDEDPIVVLDFFAGSGTTAHAVAELNTQDNGRRECILVTLEENNIPQQVTLPRLKALFSGNWVIGKMKPLKGQVKFFTQKFSSTKITPKQNWDINEYSEEYRDFCLQKIEELNLI